MSFFKKDRTRKSSRGSSSSHSSNDSDIQNDGSEGRGNGSWLQATSSLRPTNGTSKISSGRLLGGSTHRSDDDSTETRQNEDNAARAASSKLHSIECQKHPGHKEFIPVGKLQPHHLPPPYRTENWVRFLRLKGEETVHISVSYTSNNRPEELGFQDLRGTTKVRIGSGTAFIMNMENTEDCYCGEIEGAHKVSGSFKVMTVAHVVFDDAEAQSTFIKFFLDDDSDSTAVVTARGERVSHIDIQRNRSVIECRTHDLTLFQRLSNSRNERMRLIQNSLSTEVNHEPMVVLISHPHGMSKCVSIGRLLAIQEEGDVKTTQEGVELIGCFLAYDTPTCPGAGGGSINLIGKGEVCYAFAPHCASHSDGKNTSGLGWTKYVKSLELRR
ncbi:unnamed protein product [Candidula unifasciata]|uniref:Uncharacterized protein n=1 Tax=Candidula unifasciata TaxID=100452 RepID=A0A8S4A3C0_9EUPU|nr:unnamed protein product [Candidula unifasciata]